MSIQAGHAGDHPQELADVAQGLLAHLENVARLGTDQLQPLASMAHANAAARRQIVAIEGTQQGAFTGAGLAVQHQAFTALHTELDAAQHVEHHAMLLMQGEGFREVTDLDQGICHGCNTEDTSS